MTEGSDTERVSTWIANCQVTARKNETGLSPVVWNSNYLFDNFYVGQVTHLTTPRSAPERGLITATLFVVGVYGDLNCLPFNAVITIILGYSTESLRITSRFCQCSRMIPNILT